MNDPANFFARIGSAIKAEERMNTILPHGPSQSGSGDPDNGIIQSKTPLTDSMDHGMFNLDPDIPEWVPLKDCRVIELRLNECVSVLESLLPNHSALCGIEPCCQCDRATQNKRTMIDTAITNAKKPL